MAFGSKKRASGHGEAELLHGLIALASEIQSSPELDGIVRAIATTVTQTFGYREATVYIVDDDDDTSRGNERGRGARGRVDHRSDDSDDNSDDEQQRD